MQSQTERDHDGLRALREREASRKVRDQVDELADAIDEDGAVTRPIPHDEELTSPREMLELDDNDARFTAIWNRIDRLILAVGRGKRDTADRITDAMGKRPPNERLTSVETRVKIIWVILAAIGTFALGSAITVAKGLYERGETDGQHEIRLQQVERELERLDHEFIDGRRHSEPPPFLQIPKGPTP